MLLGFLILIIPGSLIGFFFTLALGGIAMWIRKIFLKRRMESGLGRRVEDRDLTDIAAWMEAIPEEKTPAQDQNSRPHL
jgi:cytochrome c